MEQLIIYPNNIANLITPVKSTANNLLDIDLINTVIEDTILIYGDNIIYRYTIKGNNLVVQLPIGNVEVVDNNDNILNGDLDSLNSKELTLIIDQKRVNITDYKQLTFIERYNANNPIDLTYLFSGIGWDAIYTLIVDDEMNERNEMTERNETSGANHINKFILNADIKNTTNKTFDTHVILATNNIKINTEVTGNRYTESKMLAAAPMPGSQKNYNPSYIDKLNLNTDNATIDLGKQIIKDSTEFLLYDLSDIKSNKYVYQKLGFNKLSSNKVHSALSFYVPEDIILPAGKIKIFKSSNEVSRVNEVNGVNHISYLTSQLIPTKRSRELVEINLGTTNKVSISTTVTINKRKDSENTNDTTYYYDCKLTSEIICNESVDVKIYFDMNGMQLLECSCEHYIKDTELCLLFNVDRDTTYNCEFTILGSEYKADIIY